MKLSSDEINRLAALCKQGDMNAKKRIYEAFAKQMMSLCYRYLCNKQDAEDAMTDGFVSMYENITQFKDGNFEAWLYRIMVNSCLAVIRKSKRTVYKENEYELENTNDFTLSDNAEYSEEDLMNALNILTPTERCVFNLSAIDGYTHEEIAAQLNVKQPTVITMLYRGKTKLRKYLIDLKTERN